VTSGTSKKDTQFCIRRCVPEIGPGLLPDACTLPKDIKQTVPTHSFITIHRSAFPSV
jgi:hypothetical protein